jgi:hypothetical protein
MNKEMEAKVGTIPMRIILRNATNVKIGDRVKFRMPMPGSKWETGIVDRLTPRIFIERM